MNNVNIERRLVAWDEPSTLTATSIPFGRFRQRLLCKRSNAVGRVRPVIVLVRDDITNLKAGAKAFCGQRCPDDVLHHARSVIGPFGELCGHSAEDTELD
jgi:hypothetical protein